MPAETRRDFVPATLGTVSEEVGERRLESLLGERKCKCVSFFPICSAASGNVVKELFVVP